MLENKRPQDSSEKCYSSNALQERGRTQGRVYLAFTRPDLEIPWFTATLSVSIAGFENYDTTIEVIRKELSFKRVHIRKEKNSILMCFECIYSAFAWNCMIPRQNISFDRLFALKWENNSNWMFLELPIPGFRFNSTVLFNTPLDSIAGFGDYVRTMEDYNLHHKSTVCIKMRK